jgi:hypothetical protein
MPFPQTCTFKLMLMSLFLCNMTLLLHVQLDDGVLEVLTFTLPQAGATFVHKVARTKKAIFAAEPFWAETKHSLRGTGAADVTKLSDTQLLLTPGKGGQMDITVEDTVSIPRRSSKSFGAMFAKGWPAAYLSDKDKCVGAAWLKPAAGTGTGLHVTWCLLMLGVADFTVYGACLCETVSEQCAA